MKITVAAGIMAGLLVMCIWVIFLLCGKLATAKREMVAQCNCFLAQIVEAKEVHDSLQKKICNLEQEKAESDGLLLEMLTGVNDWTAGMRIMLSQTKGGV